MKEESKQRWRPLFGDQPVSFGVSPLSCLKGVLSAVSLLGHAENPEREGLVNHEASWRRQGYLRGTSMASGLPTWFPLPIPEDQASARLFPLLCHFCSGDRLPGDCGCLRKGGCPSPSLGGSLQPNEKGLLSWGQLPHLQGLPLASSGGP